MILKYHNYNNIRCPRLVVFHGPETARAHTRGVGVGVGAQVLWDAAALDNLALIRQVDYKSVHDACTSALNLALIPQAA
jgi:hypothetical protein